MPATRVVSPDPYPAAAVVLSLGGCGLVAALALVARLCGFDLAP